MAIASDLLAAPAEAGRDSNCLRQSSPTRRLAGIFVTLSLALGSLALGSLSLAACDGPSVGEDAGLDCQPRSIDCACGEDGVCERGQCVADVCTLCTRGDLSCNCRRDGSCGDGLLCEEAQCRECPEGSPGCACERGGGCDEGSECSDGVCAPLGCPPGSTGCPCRVRSAPACDDTLSCLGDGLCNVCDADRAGCPCAADGSCSAGLTCELGQCAAPPTCADLVEEGFCGPAERCEVGDDGAQCLRGQCADGFVFDGGECIEGRANCESGAAGSLVEHCNDLFRTCIEEAGAARCGECSGDTTENDGVCIGPVPCGDNNCSSFEYCDRSGLDPFCTELPCPAGQARGTGGACIPCGFTCTGEGLSGRVFPFRTVTDACVCETLPGYYMPPGGSTDPEACDADGDGWVRAEVTESLIQVDPALTQNARCALIEVDGVLLRDEQGLSAEVASCDSGLLLAPDPSACPNRIPMPLVESRRNDTPGPLGGAAIGAPGAYGDRRLQGGEVNDLTKFCVDDASDFNDDGTDDLLEEQAAGATLGSADGRTRLRSFAHFVELQRSYVLPPAEGVRYGKLVIEERFRCDPRDFALRYDSAVDPARPSDDYISGEDSVYWRSCQRGVDPGFNPGTANGPGFDFAQWGCEGGDCTDRPAGPPDDAVNLVNSPLTFGNPIPFGTTLCELGARLPADGIWRGMNHHSQFKCVHAGGAGPAAVPLTTVSGGGMVFNECSALRCDPSDGSCVDSRPVAPGGDSREPVLHCRAVDALSIAAVGFAAVRYRPYGTRFVNREGDRADYLGGCVNEDAEFAEHLCPAPVFQTHSAVEAFGRHTCFVAPCPLGQADCDGNEFNGCEMEARSLVDCNGCGVACAPAHAAGDCSAGFCQVALCDPGFGNCDGNPDTGCETLLRTNTHCAACNRACTSPSGETSCASGGCAVVSCETLSADCDGLVDNGCETDLTDEPTCGSCDTPCAPPNASASFCNETGVCEVLSCEFGRGDCDGDSGNGCEVDLLTSLEHCGSCSTEAFPTFCELPQAAAACTAGVCGVHTCDPGYSDCDGLAQTGCETHSGVDESNCGRCFSVCDIPNADEQCLEGACVLTGCDDARSDCDEDVAGCETRHDLRSGSCGMAQSLGSMGGDLKCPSGFLGTCQANTSWQEHRVVEGTGEGWFEVQAEEDSACHANVEHRIRLNVPSGVDYDLEIQVACESGSTVTSDPEGVGGDESVTLTSTERLGSDNSFTYYIFIRYISGASCAPWELVVEGHPC